MARSWHSTLTCLLLASSSFATAQTDEPAAADDVPPRNASERAAAKDPSSSIIVRGRPWLFNRETRYSHSLPEVDGATITVTKKTTVVKLGEQPTTIDNNQRELFDRLPGIVLAEQQNPTQLNLSYRGLGNPQESEYVLLLQDGIPLELDWIGFPTLYYLPVPQTIGSVQMIRGGSGLLYGPEPQPVINFISRAPDAGRSLTGTTEQVGGTDSLFSSFNSICGTAGDWNYLADYSRRASDGQRANGDYALNAGDLHVGYRVSSQQQLSLDVHAYSLDSGLAGLMSGAQFHANRNQTTTPDDRLWTDRYTAVLTYENKLSEHDQYTQKLWTGYQDLVTRSDKYSAGALLATAATLSGQRFHYTGLDGRLLHRWGTGDALTVGYTAYSSRSPYDEFTSQNPLAGRNDKPGTPLYLDERKTRYAALFAENVFRFRHFHLVASARFDHEELQTHEVLAPHPSLVEATYRKNIPLFGIGIGTDFGRGNESYLNVSQGFRPLRYLDIASPFSNFSPNNNPAPTKYLTYEAGVHGWPSAGLYYDVGLFQVNVRNRIESQRLTQTETLDVNTGDTRSRGAELEGSYDLLRMWPQSAPHRHVTLFANASFLDARFTKSGVPGQTGRTPAYAPRYVLKGGVTLREERHYTISLIADSVASQYFQDSDLGVGSTPARIPAYTVIDLSADYVVAGHLRLLGGISNLGDRHYYSRVFLFGGSLEPARDRAFHAGLAYDF
ncbi:MAG: TonB-dependent receptor [Gammaproteobacteria bacterium]|nr:TonB-dependent receptor [Gammaproteobacteria bacterium]